MLEMVTRNLKAFVVDDYRPARDSLGMLLTALGWEVQRFSSAAECFEASIHERPDCILTDLQMPVMTGSELAERLRDEGLGVPIIAVTGAPPESEVVRRALAAGVKQIVRKPYGLEEIQRVLREALPH